MPTISITQDEYNVIMEGFEALLLLVKVVMAMLM